MKGFLTATVAVALAAAAFAAWGTAAPAEQAPEATAANASPDVRRRPRGGARLPATPAEVRRRGRWIIGVKCDTPPFGYTDPEGRLAGYDVEIGRWFARFSFGRASRVRFECVTTASRIPALTSRRVDIIIATITWFPDRAQEFDFSIPYYSEVGRLLIRRGQNVSLGNLAGKTVTTTGGSIYEIWLRACFRQTRILPFQGTAPPLLALKDGRADAFMYDGSFLSEYVLRDPDVRLTRDIFARAPWGIGIRKGDRATKRFVDSRLRLLQRRNQFVRILRANAAPVLFRALQRNVPAPKRSFRYPRANTREEMMPCPR